MKKIGLFIALFISFFFILTLPLSASDLCKEDSNIYKAVIKSGDSQQLKIDLTERASKIFYTEDQDKLTCTKEPEPTYKDELASFKELILRIQTLKKHSLSFEDKKLLLFLSGETEFKLGDYEKAQQQYVNLKLLITDKSDLLFQGLDEKIAVSARLAGIKKRRDSMEQGINKIPKEFWLPSLAISLFTLSFVVFWFIKWHRYSFSLPIKSGYGLKTEIVPKDHLISSEEMREQDGRVSQEVYEAYEKAQQRGDAVDSEGFRNARLLAKGHAMICDVNNLAPYPLAVIARIPLLRQFHFFWQYTVTSFLFIGFWSAAKWAVPSKHLFYQDLVPFFLIAALLAMSFTALRLMAMATINGLDEVVSMLEPKSAKVKKDESGTDSVLVIERLIAFLFRSPWQFFVVLVILAIILLRKIVLHDHDHSWDPALLVNMYFCTLILFMVCPIIWQIIGSVIVLNRICRMKDLGINPLSPLKTMGLEKWISIIGTYGISSSIVLSFGAAIPIIMRFTNNVKFDGGWFWFILIMPLLFFYWIYPYVKLSSMVKQKKMQRMQYLKIKILSIFNDWTYFEEKNLDKLLKCREAMDKEGYGKLSAFRLEMMEKSKAYLEPMANYYEIFKKIDESPQSYINFNSIFELAKAMGLPSLFAILSAYFL